MIAAAQQRAESLGAGKVAFSQATIFDATLLADSYDAVLALAIFHLLDDTPRVLERIRELLKPGGTLVSVTPCLGEAGSLAIRIAVVGVRIATWMRLVPRVRFFKLAELQGVLVAAGFELTQMERLEGGTPEYFVVARRA